MQGGMSMNKRISKCGLNIGGLPPAYSPSEFGATTHIPQVAQHLARRGTREWDVSALSVCEICNRVKEHGETSGE